MTTARRRVTRVTSSVQKPTTVSDMCAHTHMHNQHPLWGGRGRRIKKCDAKMPACRALNFNSIESRARAVDGVAARILIWTLRRLPNVPVRVSVSRQEAHTTSVYAENTTATRAVI